MATPASSGPEPDASTRDRILDIALETFAELGFDGASTRTIATRASVNQGLITYYFGSKDALWREAVDRAFEGLNAAVGRATIEAESLGSARERFELIIRRYVRFVAAHPEFVLLMNEEGKRTGPRMRWIVDRHVKPIYGAMIELLNEPEMRARMPAQIDPVHYHYIFLGAVGAFFTQAPECRRVSGTDPYDPKQVEAHADAIVHLFLGAQA
jgi:AcrR family transcriptional regulator